MPLSDFLKEFGLDPELINRDREISTGLAKAHENISRDIPDRDADRRFVHVMASATEYRRAGAHSVLLSDRKTAVDMFRRAGRLYARERRPYALMMFSCSEEDLGSVMASAHDFGSGEGIDRTQLSYLLLASAAGREDRDRQTFKRIGNGLVSSQTAPIGVLGIPIGAYLDLANTLAFDEPAPQRMSEMILPFLVPYSTAIRRCMQDRYHWERMAFPFHPAEPDVLGVLFCVEAALRWRQQPSLLRVLEGIPLGEVPTDLLYNAILERFEGGQHPLRQH
jgi:hypothetical protein